MPRQHLHGQLSNQSSAAEIKNQPPDTCWAHSYPWDHHFSPLPSEQRAHEVTAPATSSCSTRASQHLAWGYSSHHQHRPALFNNTCQIHWVLVLEAKVASARPPSPLAFLSRVHTRLNLSFLRKNMVLLPGKLDLPCAMLPSFLTHLLERTGWSGQMQQVLHMPLVPASTQHACGYAHTQPPALTLL